MKRLEYRIRWQREGRGVTYRLYQTEAAARRKIDGILALEEIKGDTREWEDMPDLVAPPELQVREVGEWSAVETQDAPSESAREGIAAWTGVHDRDDEVIFG